LTHADNCTINTADPYPKRSVISELGKSRSSDEDIHLLGTPTSP
jgi:hypothetical protein